VPYHYFVSESGNPSFQDDQNYCVVAVCVDDSHLMNIETKISWLCHRIKHQYRLKDGSLFLKAGDILRARYQYAPLSLEDRVALFREVCEFIKTLDIAIIAVYFDKNIVYSKKAYKENSRFWAKHWTWKLLMERISQYALPPSTLILNSINSIANEGQSDFIHDILEERDNYIDTNFHATIDYQYKGDNQFLQLADIIAWTIRRYYLLEPTIREEDNIYDQLANDAFNLLSTKFARDDAGQVEGFGLKIFPSLHTNNKSHRLSPGLSLGEWLFGSSFPEPEFLLDSDDNMK